MEDLPYAENRATYDPAHPGRLSVEYTYHPELLPRRRTFRRAISRAFKGQRRVFLHGAGAVVEQGTEVLPPRGLKGKLKDLLLLRRRRPRRLV